MLFRSRYIIPNFGLINMPDSFEIDSMSDPRIKMALCPIKSEEIKDSYKEDDWVVMISTEEDVSEKVTAQFTNAKDEPTVAVREIGNRVRDRNSSFLKEFLKIIRWRSGIDGHHLLIRAENLPEWSNDGISWKPVFRGRISFSGSLDAVQFQQSTFDDMKRMLRASDYEPLSHELFREAWELRRQSPRSALMLGVSALEIGVKEFITKLVPQSEWLCFEMPSPPVVRMLEEYLRELPVTLRINRKVFVPDKIIKVLKKAVANRNRVTHRGAQIFSDESLDEILSYINATLYLLDYYVGHQWAVKNIRVSGLSDILEKEFKDASSDNS